jgi:hypothetical protein
MEKPRRRDKPPDASSPGYYSPWSPHESTANERRDAKVAGSSLMSSILKIVAGSLCGFVAYQARSWGSGPQADIVVWTLVGLAGNFYLNVLTQFIQQSLRPRGSPATPIMQASRNLVTAGILGVFCLLAARFSQASLIVLYSEQDHKPGNQLLPEAGIWLLSMAIFFGAPPLAAWSAWTIVHSLASVLDRESGDRGIYGLLAAAAAIGAFVLAGVLLWHGILNGEAIAKARGIWPFGD